LSSENKILRVQIEELQTNFKGLQKHLEGQEGTKRAEVAKATKPQQEEDGPPKRKSKAPQPHQEEDTPQNSNTLRKRKRQNSEEEEDEAGEVLEKRNKMLLYKIKNNKFTYMGPKYVTSQDDEPFGSFKKGAWQIYKEKERLRRQNLLQQQHLLLSASLDDSRANLDSLESLYSV